MKNWLYIHEMSSCLSVFKQLFYVFPAFWQKLKFVFTSKTETCLKLF